jgi:hypothetical protein
MKPVPHNYTADEERFYKDLVIHLICLLHSPLVTSKEAKLNSISLSNDKHTQQKVMYDCYLLDWKRDSAENGLGLAAGGRLKGLAVAAGGGRGGANIGGGKACAEGCIGWVAGRGTGGGVGRGTDAAGDNCCPLELEEKKQKKNK